MDSFFAIAGSFYNVSSKNKEHRQKVAGSCVPDGLLFVPWRCALARAPGDAFQGDGFVVLGHFYAQRNEICRETLAFCVKMRYDRNGKFRRAVLEHLLCFEKAV